MGFTEGRKKDGSRIIRPTGKGTGSTFINLGKDSAREGITPPGVPPTQYTSAETPVTNIDTLYEAFKTTTEPSQVTLRDYTGRTATLPAGDLTAAAPFLTGGNCHSLAAALHEATGYPIIGFIQGDNYPYDEDDDEYEDETIKHFAVLTPDGYVLDGDGAMPLKIVEERTLWESFPVSGHIEGMKTLIQEEEQTMERTWQTLNPALVTSYIEPILNKYRDTQK
jgi:hypothetical protein